MTGSTGSGKSSILAALVNEINQKVGSYILTIEYSVEFVHTSQRSLVNQREGKMNTRSFNTALKSLLSEDPYCILVGEMHDLETIILVLETAETDNLVLGTLHTMSAMVISVFPPVTGACTQYVSLSHYKLVYYRAYLNVMVVAVLQHMRFLFKIMLLEILLKKTNFRRFILCTTNWYS